MRTKPNPVDVYVGERLRSLRTSCALSLGELARMLSVTPKELEDFETGSARIGARQLLRASETLKVPVSYFFQGFNKPAESDVDIMTTEALLKRAADEDSGT